MSFHLWPLIFVFFTYHLQDKCNCKRRKFSLVIRMKIADQYLIHLFLIQNSISACVLFKYFTLQYLYSTFVIRTKPITLYILPIIHRYLYILLYYYFAITRPKSDLNILKSYIFKCLNYDRLTVQNN